MQISFCYKKYDSKYQSKKDIYLEKLGRNYYPHLKIFTVERTSSFVKGLNNSERQQLFSELQKYEVTSGMKGILHNYFAFVSV